MQRHRPFARRPTTASIRTNAAILVALLILGAGEPSGLATGKAQDIALPPEPPVDVTSVKINTSGAMLFHVSHQPNGFSATNVPLRQLMLVALGVQPYQLVNVPEWVVTARFDVAARVAGAPLRPGDRNAQRGVVRTVLRERFQLQTHEETRDLPLYELARVLREERLGPDLRPASGDCRQPPTLPESIPCGMSGGLGGLNGRSATTAELAASLALQVARPVIDGTGLAGTFDLRLRWTPDTLPPRAPGTSQPIRVNGIEIDPEGPSLFTALREQLALTLNDARGPVPVVVIDSISRPLPD